MAWFEPYIDAEGIHVPTYDDTLSYIIDQYKKIFGDDVYISEDSPDYQMISIFAKLLSDYSTLAVDCYNNRDPNYAYGNSLDLIVQLAGINRRVATYSEVTLKVTGEEGTVIAAGSKVIDKSGYIWSTEEDATIPAAGYTDVPASCDTPGAVEALAGTIIGIYTPLPGWTAVTNQSPATVGKNTESDSELRDRFFASHSYTPNGVADSLIAGLRSVSGVEYVALKVNDTNGTVDSMPPHSFCALVQGGDADEIAEAIYKHKATGVGTYGTTQKTVVDEYGGSHTVKFTRPTEKTVSVSVTIVNLGGYTEESAPEIDLIIKNALMADINSLGIGKDWVVTTGYKDIYSAFGNDLPFSISSISATKQGGSSTTSTVSALYYEILNTDASHITIST